LAGISIYLILGENGILNQAKYAQREYSNSQGLEEKEMNQLYTEMMIATNDSSQVTINIKQLLDVMYPVGSIYISTSGINPQELFGGQWESYGEGRTLIGAGSGTDINNETVEFLENTTGGEYNHLLTVNEMTSHTHGLNYGGTILAVRGSKTEAERAPGIQPVSGGWWNNTNKYEANIAQSGGSNTHNNIQPYIVTYMWRRIS